MPIKRIKKIVQKIGKKAGEPLGNVLAAGQRYKGYVGRDRMVNEAVERIVRKKYGGGRPLAGSEANNELRKKERKELVKRLTKKNKNLLKF